MPTKRLIERIDRRLEAVGLTERKASLQATGKVDSIRNIRRGRAPRAATLHSLARVLEVPVDELLEVTEEFAGADETLVDRSAEPRQASSLIPEVNVVGSAGAGAIVDFESVVAEWRFPTDWIRSEVRGSPDHLRIATVEGDSMRPTLEPGEKVVVDTSRRSPSPPGIYFVHDGFGLVVKRLQVNADADPPRIKFTSDNTRYDAYERTIDEVHIIGRVMGRWERLG